MLTHNQMSQCLGGLRARFDGAQVLHRGTNRVVLRTSVPGMEKAIVIKLWSRPDFRGGLRRLLGIAPSAREWRNLVRLRSLKLPVPNPLGQCSVVPRIAGYTDALFMEDLGDCESSTDHLKSLIQRNQGEAALRFEDALIEMTAQILDAGMIDVDHGLANIVVQAPGRPVRLDLELARRVFLPRAFVNMYGDMLGRFVGMHAFAVQPDMARSRQFADRLRARLRPPKSVLARAADYARKMMERQKKDTGIDTRLALPWG